MESEIKRDKHGFYTLCVDGKFEGNYDSYTEAANAYEEIAYPGEANKNSLNQV
nr:MAG TPA: hypothetical protein [Caudoviricetes sp.]